MRVNGVRLGAIDVGTNTTRMLAVEVTPGDLGELDRRLTFTRLGEGVDATRRITPAAIGRTVSAISEFVARCRALGVGPIRIAGTSAVREAANREELRAAVRAATGLDLEVIPGGKEAALSFAGATQDLPAGRYLVCDIGGGSTELAEGSKPGQVIEARISLPLGVVRLTERHLRDDPPTGEELAALEAGIDSVLDEAAAVLDDPASRRLVGVAGTVTSLAAIRLGLDRYDPKAVHGSQLTAGEVNDLYRRLAGMTLREREALPPLPVGRADVIVAGCAILSRVMARWAFPAVRVSEKDILDGLVLELMS
ncbi:MAG TPA: Ppx/GppA phosphatase family protein [Actinomycetota bacterium]|nr:Ppx/GppA phosphatase family protein [Actinomycetota bacterium]